MLQTFTSHANGQCLGRDNDVDDDRFKSGRTGCRGVTCGSGYNELGSTIITKYEKSKLFIPTDVLSLNGSPKEEHISATLGLSVIMVSASSTCQTVDSVAVPSLGDEEIRRAISANTDAGEERRTL